MKKKTKAEIRKLKKELEILMKIKRKKPEEWLEIAKILAILNVEGELDF